MKKGAWLLLFLLLALAENAWAFVIPLDFAFASYSWPVHFVLIGSLLYTARMNRTDRLLWMVLLGLLYDLLFSGSFPYSALYFGAAGMIFSLSENWRGIFKEGLLLLLCFLYDALPMGFLMAGGILQCSLLQFLILMELPAFLINIVSMQLINRLFAWIEPGYHSVLPDREVFP